MTPYQICRFITIDQPIEVFLIHVVVEHIFRIDVFDRDSSISRLESGGRRAGRRDLRRGAAVQGTKDASPRIQIVMSVHQRCWNERA